MVNAHKVKMRHLYCEQLPVQWEKEVRAFFFPHFQFHCVILSNQPYPCNLGEEQGDLFWFENKMWLNHFCSVIYGWDARLKLGWNPKKFFLSVQYLNSHLHSEHHARCIYLSKGYFILKLHFSCVIYAIPPCTPAAFSWVQAQQLPPQDHHLWLQSILQTEAAPAAAARAGTAHGVGSVTPGQRGSTQQPGHHRRVNYPLLWMEA